MPRGIWALGLCSMFMDISSELVHSLLPVLLSTVLGASMLTIGLIEGVAEATASLPRSSRAASVIGWAAASRWRCWAMALLRSPNRSSPGGFGRMGVLRALRRPHRQGDPRRPRDALIADLVPAERRGAAYGLRQSLDSVGAFVGPALAILAMGWFAGDVQVVMWVAVLPALLAVAVLVLG